nr:daunorubicin resistance ABC transporter, ATP-binding protein [uncultured bacterium]
MTSKDTAISVTGLKKSYGDNHVLKGVSFSVKRGTMLALLGPNGAGKTTMVRILSTLLRHDAGKVSIEGYDISKDSDKVRGVIGLTGQSASVDELLTGRENLVMMGRLYRLTKASATARAAELLTDFDLNDAADRQVKTYSGGMRRRLDLAVSLIAAPPIIFLDEPTTGLDPRSRIAMWEIIRKLMTDGTTILLTTQYLDEADQLADNIIVIDGGTVIAEGTANDLKSKVGKDRLELVFPNAKSLEQAVKALSEDKLDANTKLHSASLPINNTNHDIKRVLDRLSQQSVSIESLSVHKPTLDDVFLSVTGKQKPKEDEEADT